MGCGQVWGIFIEAKDQQSFKFLKSKVIEMFGDDVDVSENDLTFYKLTYSYKSWNWFDSIKQFFEENVEHIDPDSIANVRYCAEPDEMVRASDFKEKKEVEDDKSAPSDLMTKSLFNQFNNPKKQGGEKGAKRQN